MGQTLSSLVIEASLNFRVGNESILVLLLSTFRYPRTFDTLARYDGE